MKIFISYRRSDSKVFTGRILDRLTGAFGKRSIFRDIEDIPAGMDFRQVLRDAVDESHIMLVMIGPQWTNITNADGEKRLFDPNDFVRFEVETALKRKDLTVIPVLVLNASMPTPEELPEELRELAYRNATVVRDDPDFPTDLQRLINQIRRVRPIENILRWAMYALPVATLLAYAIFAMQNFRPDPSNTNQTDIPLSTTSVTNNETPAAIAVGTKGKVLKGFTLYQEADENSLIKALIQSGTSVEVVDQNKNGDWLQVKLVSGEDGWVKTNELYLPAPIPVTPISVGKGYGARSDAWQVYFTSPTDNPNPATDLGIEVRLADAINRVEHTLDIAAYDFDNKILTQSVLDAHQNGVVVRIITDDEEGLGRPENSFQQFIDAGIPVLTDNRSSLMHDKFMILDGKTVWTGSWNYTESGTYASNNNALAFESAELVRLYQYEFDQMFEKQEFSPNSPGSPTNIVSGIPIEVYFSPHDPADTGIANTIGSARKSVYFMAFSFTDDDFGALFKERHEAGVKVTGIFEKVGSTTGASEFTPLHCAGVDVRTDGSKYSLHHKVIIVDESIVITGSANFSLNAMKSNNENTIIIYDPTLAAVYMEEFNRQWAIASAPTDITCP